MIFRGINLGIRGDHDVHVPVRYCPNQQTDICIYRVVVTPSNEPSSRNYNTGLTQLITDIYVMVENPIW